jgi:hypothetical protein
MPKEVFDHHVSEEKNDFSSWIEHVVGDKELAKKVASVKTAKTMSKYVNERIRQKNVKERVKRPVNVEETEIPLAELKKRVKKRTEQRWHESILGKKQAKETRPRLTGPKCLYKSYKCGWQEFLVGIIVGLIIATVLSVLL